ncbi:hypothetical protein, partial [Clostridium perfringens]
AYNEFARSALSDAMPRAYRIDRTAASPTVYVSWTIRWQDDAASRQPAPRPTAGGLAGSNA